MSSVARRGRTLLASSSSGPLGSGPEAPTAVPRSTSPPRQVLLCLGATTFAAAGAGHDPHLTAAIGARGRHASIEPLFLSWEGLAGAEDLWSWTPPTCFTTRLPCPLEPTSPFGHSKTNSSRHTGHTFPLSPCGHLWGADRRPTGCAALTSCPQSLFLGLLGAETTYLTLVSTFVYIPP